MEKIIDNDLKEKKVQKYIFNFITENELSGELSDQIDTSQLSANQRLYIHQRHYWTSLSKALSTHLPMTQELLSDYWQAITRDYFDEFPVKYGWLRGIEANFHEWLTKTNLPIIDCVIDIAKFEIDMQKTIYSNLENNNSIQLDINTMEYDESSYFKLSNNYIMSSFNYPVHNIHQQYQLVLNDINILDKKHELIRIVEQSKPDISHLLFMKESEHTVSFINIAPEIYKLILLIDKLPLKEALNKVSADNSDFNLQPALNYLLTNNIIENKL